jgi:hypothetical protein
MLLNQLHLLWTHWLRMLNRYPMARSVARLCCKSHTTAAQLVVERVGGTAALNQFCRLFTQGYPKRMQRVDAGLAQQHKCYAVGRSNSSKRTSDEATAADRLRVWRRFGGQLPGLQQVALCLLSAHATSAATERNWSLLCRIYCAARSSLGMQPAKALTAIRAAEQAKLDPSKELEITLSVIDGEEQGVA